MKVKDPQVPQKVKSAYQPVANHSNRKVTISVCRNAHQEVLQDSAETKKINPQVQPKKTTVHPVSENLTNHEAMKVADPKDLRAVHLAMVMTVATDHQDHREETMMHQV